MSVISLPLRSASKPWTTKRVLSTSFSAVSTLFIVAFFFLAWPASLGGKATWVTVSGTSMLPDYRTGDMVLAWNDGAWGLGDVVLYSMDGTSTNLIVHRLIDGNATQGWTAQGDNKPAPDPWRIPAENVRGRELVHIPYLGVILSAARTPQVLALATGILVFGAVLVMPRRKRRLERIKVDEPCVANGVSGVVKDIHVEGVRIVLDQDVEIGQHVDLSVWLNASDGSKRIVRGSMDVRYNTVLDDGHRAIGGPVTWVGEHDVEIIEQHCSSYVLRD